MKNIAIIVQLKKYLQTTISINLINIYPLQLPDAVAFMSHAYQNLDLIKSTNRTKVINCKLKLLIHLSFKSL